MSITMRRVLGLSVWLATVSSTCPTLAADHPIGHTTSTTKFGGTPLVGKQYKLVAKAAANGNPAAFPLPASVPFFGNQVTVAYDGGTLSDPLYGGTWVALGDPPGAKGYKYTNRGTPFTGIVKQILIKPTSIKIATKGTGSLLVPGAVNGPIDTLLVAGGERYCARAETPHYQEVVGRTIKTKNQLPPASCPACNPGTDSDADRLDDCYETNTGIFLGPTDTGTDPGDPDTDGDGLSDGNEVLGTVGGLDLPALGASPLRQDILIEYDWFDDGLECGAHSHRPTPLATALVSNAFAAAPVTNPDGSTGINVIHDYGQGGVFTGGNLVADADGVLLFGVNNPEFNAIKSVNFAANRNGYFHYVVLPHRYDTNSTSSGQAELPGDDMIVSLYCYAVYDDDVAHTIMHELGHNLGLRHGGFESCNYKPNYNSVMNYLYQFPGVDTDCTPPGNGLLDYSHGARITLNETNLNESAGTCGAPPWDWNGNSVLENGIAVDLNAADTSEGLTCGGTLTILQDWDDWAAVSLGNGLFDSDGTSRTPVEVVDCVNSPSSSH